MTNAQMVANRQPICHCKNTMTNPPPQIRRLRHVNDPTKPELKSTSHQRSVYQRRTPETVAATFIANRSQHQSRQWHVGCQLATSQQLAGNQSEHHEWRYIKDSHCATSAQPAHKWLPIGNQYAIAENSICRWLPINAPCRSSEPPSLSGELQLCASDDTPTLH